ncbi:peroxiredoxin [Arthrobacter tecti]
MDQLPAVGGRAPAFELPNQHGEPVSLASLRGTAAALVFYPFAFSRVCTGELDELQAQSEEFRGRNVRLLAISVDSKYTLRAYAEERGYDFDLLADFWPHGAVADTYGVLDHTRGYARRATFFLDPDGVVIERIDAALGDVRPFDSYLSALHSLSVPTIIRP